jgi:hypothetical protein
VWWDAIAIGGLGLRPPRRRLAGSACCTHASLMTAGLRQDRRCLLLYSTGISLMHAGPNRAAFGTGIDHGARRRRPCSHAVAAHAAAQQQQLAQPSSLMSTLAMEGDESTALSFSGLRARNNAGDEVLFEGFRGKVVLVVNVARL